MYVTINDGPSARTKFILNKQNDDFIITFMERFSYSSSVSEISGKFLKEPQFVMPPLPFSNLFNPNPDILSQMLVPIPLSPQI